MKFHWSQAEKDELHRLYPDLDLSDVEPLPPPQLTQAEIDALRAEQAEREAAEKTKPR